MGEHPLLTVEASEAVLSEVHHHYARRQGLSDELDRHLGGEHLVSLSQAPKPGGPVEAGPVVLPTTAVGLDGVDPTPHPDRQSPRPRLGGQGSVNGESSPDGVEGPCESGDGGVALAHGHDEAATGALDPLRYEGVVADQSSRHCRRIVFPERGGTLDVSHEKGGDAGREHRVPPGAQLLHKLAWRGLAGRRIEGERPAEGGLERRPPSLLYADPRGSRSCRRRPSQQGEGCRAERIDVGRWRSWSPRRHLGSDETWRAHARRSCARPRGCQPEVHQDYPAARRQDEVGGLDIAMDDRRIMLVEVRQCVGRLRQRRQDAAWRKPSASVDGQEPLEIGAIDPIHHDDVAVAVEEVVAREG